MIKYTIMHKLFVLFNVPNNPMKHWFDGVGWEMANFMCEQVLKKIQSVVVISRFVYLGVDEVKINDDQSWILINVYVM